MPVKYCCPKCEKRFVDWGAEKLNFRCPDCVGEELVPVGGSVPAKKKAPSLKRKPRKKKAAAKPKPKAKAKAKAKAKDVSAVADVAG
jgi:hypothetical protein